MSPKRQINPSLARQLLPNSELWFLAHHVQMWQLCGQGKVNSFVVACLLKSLLATYLVHHHALSRIMYLDNSWHNYLMFS